jgi:hypothetical protein
MVNKERAIEIIKAFKAKVTDQIERIVYDPTLSYMSWDEILSDINLLIEVWNLLEVDNVKLSIRAYLEKNFYDEELEDIIEKLKQIENKQNQQ